MLEFPQHYELKPAIRCNGNHDFSVDDLGAKGVPVHDEFEYHSGANSHFLSINEISALNESCL